MIHQVLVISPEGLCLVDRTYDENSIDPFLVSGFLAAVLPRMEEFGFTLDSMMGELHSDKNSHLSVLMHNGLIYAGIASISVTRDELNLLLSSLSKEISAYLSEIPDFHSMTQDQLANLEDQIDITVSQEGIPSISDGEGLGILPILEKVYAGKMKPDKAAKTILKSIEKHKKTKNLETIKHSLKLLDPLFPPTKGSKMDPIQVVIQATYKGVSKMTVRMDKAMSF